MVLGVLAVAVAGIAVANAQVAPGTAPSGQVTPPEVASVVSPPGVESSVWYCPGAGTLGSASAETSLLAVNPGRRPLPATLRVVDASGKAASKSVQLPARRETVLAPSSLVDGPWLAARLLVAGGGVSVVDRLSGAAGWSSAACASETATTWYFAQGSTASGDALRVSLYNPTAALAVVDLTFYAGTTVVQPAADQGLVVPAGRVVTADVNPYVQLRPSVATVVHVVSGSLVADELQVTASGGVSGIALAAGAPASAVRWVVPETVDPSGGSATLSVFNPTAGRERVFVEATLPSGRVGPLTEVVAPHTVWSLAASSQLRIPAGEPWTAVVRTKGRGVVVGRTLSAAGSSPAGWGSAGAVAVVPGLSSRWLVGAPVGWGEAAADGPGPFTVLVSNPGRHRVRARLFAVGPKGARPLGGGGISVGPGGVVSVPVDPPLPVQVVADGTVAVTGDASGTSQVGLVDVPAVPRS